MIDQKYKRKIILYLDFLNVVEFIEGNLLFRVEKLVLVSLKGRVSEQDQFLFVYMIIDLADSNVEIKFLMVLKDQIFIFSEVQLSNLIRDRYVYW